ncbi:MAG: EAL domain-containing protein [Caulobacteraceae bacterium]
MPIAPHRLLGFAFASADLLVEIDPDDRIAFAVGAAATLAGGNEEALMGRSWTVFVDPRDQPLIHALFASLDDAARQGPVIARQAATGGREPGAFALSACRLPQNNGAISCALTRASAEALPKNANGLHDKASFESVTQGLMETAKSNGEDLELAFVEMDGLASAKQALKAEEARALELKLAGALRAQSHGGSAAAAFSDERFALVRARTEGGENLAAKLQRLIADDVDVRPTSTAIALKGDATPSQVVRAIRIALDDFIKDGVGAVEPVSLTEAVNRSVRKTLEKVDALSTTVAERRFKLAYQPVVTLKTGELHHHEVLVRFGDDASPFPMIRMAEELDLIEDLDLAITEQSIARMKTDGACKLAVNVSGRTITSANFVEGVLAMIKSAKPSLKGRLLFEVTESAAIDNLQVADRHIQALREAGCLICLDDFGAGAASLTYLQQLTLDIIKIDGAYIRELQHGGRESTFIRHLVGMCSELKVKTIAEMVETSQVEDVCRRAGVDFAQGWLYGAAEDAPKKPAGRGAPVAARRQGMKESWG